MRDLVLYLILFCFIISCAPSPKLDIEPVRIRQFKEWKAVRFHDKIELKIGWYPYEEGSSQQTSSEEWAVTFENSSGSVDGYMPVIILKQPNSQDSISFEMNIDDATLGKLLKHTLMTQIPIQRPFKDYLANADCSLCHPKEVRINR